MNPTGVVVIEAGDRLIPQGYYKGQIRSDRLVYEAQQRRFAEAIKAHMQEAQQTSGE